MDKIIGFFICEGEPNLAIRKYLTELQTSFNKFFFSNFYSRFSVTKYNCLIESNYYMIFEVLKIRGVKK